MFNFSATCSRLRNAVAVASRIGVFVSCFVAIVLPTNLQGPLGRYAGSQAEEEQRSEVEEAVCVVRSLLSQRSCAIPNPVASVRVAPQARGMRRGATRVASTLIPDNLNGCGATLRC